MEFDFVGKRVMKEWAIIKYENRSEYKKAIGLFKESMAFVSLKNERFVSELDKCEEAFLLWRTTRTRSRANYLGMYMEQINNFDPQLFEFNDDENRVTNKKHYLIDLEKTRNAIIYLWKRDILLTLI